VDGSASQPARRAEEVFGVSEWPFADRPEWTPRPPAPVVPVPAVGRTDLRGRRVIIGLPGVGWRADLRGDDPVVQGSRTYVPVLAEQEWYRAEAEQTEAFAPLVPVERVWLEALGPATLAVPAGADVLSRLVSLDAPPPRPARPVTEVTTVGGRRVVEYSDGVERRDLRAVTELFNSADGDICVRVAQELDWYRWVWSGQPPKTLEVPVHLLWVE
jgi:hypothetical protein